MSNEYKYNVGATPEQFEEIIKIVSVLNGQSGRLDFEDLTKPAPLCPKCHRPSTPKPAPPSRQLPA